MNRKRHIPRFSRYLAPNIKARREELGLTQSDLAERAGLSVSFLAAIEINNKTPSLETLDLIADVMDMEAYELLLDSRKTYHNKERVVIRKFAEEAQKRIQTAVNKALRDLSQKYAEKL